MNKIFSISMILILLAACSTSVVKFDDINYYKPNVILNIEQDSVGSIAVSKFYVKNIKTNYYHVLTIKPEWCDVFEIGDTIK